LFPSLEKVTQISHVVIAQNSIVIDNSGYVVALKNTDTPFDGDEDDTTEGRDNQGSDGVWVK